MAQQPRGRAPVEGRRLASLEASVSSLAITLTANDIELPDGADPIVVAIAAMKDFASLRAQIATLADALLEHHPQAIDGSTGAVECAIKILSRPAGEETGGTTSADAIAALEDQIDGLERQIIVKDAKIAALESGAPPVEDQGDENDEEAEDVEAAATRERPETAADVGPNYAGIFNSAELRGELDGGDLEDLQLAFSNGDYEIVALQRVAILPADLQPYEGRSIVGPAVHVRLTPADAPETLHGVGLMLQGEQIAYCQLLDPIRLDPGMEHRLHRAIFF